MLDLDIEGIEEPVLIGSGGFSTVYRCRQTALAREVAVKVLTAVDASEETLRRFERECTAIGRLSGHPNIVTVFSAGRTPRGHLYMVMELATGGSLFSRILADGPIPAEECLSLGSQLCSALEAAHDASVLHRDIKPANVLLGRPGQPLLADFGVAALADGTRSALGMFTGTIAHAAPEVLDEEPQTSRSDIYALGSTLINALTGHPLFWEDGISSSIMIKRKLTSPIPDLTTLDIAPPLAAVLQRAVAREPRDRFGSAAEFGASLAALTSEPTALRRAQSATPPAPTRDPVRVSTSWPAVGEYAEALQDMANCLAIPTLGGLTTIRDALGMPSLATGQNAVVFELKAARGTTAVRCFTRAPDDVKLRYQALTAHLAEHPCPPITPAQWHDDAVRVGARWWPAVVMPWVSGRPLDTVVGEMIDSSADMRRLASGWFDVCDALERAEIAHGDLQCGNVLIDESGQIKLVDLDGVWVPALRGQPPEELGHPNFQHPGRAKNHWGVDVDGFSALLIYASLLALAADPGLFRFNGSENLVLGVDDFRRPGETEAWSEVLRSADPVAADLFGRLETYCQSARSPSRLFLSEIVQGETPIVTPTVAGHRVHVADVFAVSSTSRTSAGPDPSKQWWSDDSDDDLTVLRPKAATSEEAMPESKGEPTGAAVRARSSWTGRNTVTAGMSAGALSGVVGCLAEAALGHAVAPRYDSLLLVVLVSGGLGATLAAWQKVAVGASWRALALVITGLGGGIGVGLAAVAVDTALFGATVHQSGHVPFWTADLIWVMVAFVVGLEVGVLRGALRTAVTGVLGGIAGGFVGGTIFALSQPVARSIVTSDGNTAQIIRYLSIDGLQLKTLLAVVASTVVIGLAIGLAERIRRDAWITVIEGAHRGHELILTRKVVTLGSASTSTMRLPSQQGVATLHATIERGVDGTSVTPHSPLLLNGAPVDAPCSARALANGDVLQIGGSFLRYQEKRRG